MAPTKLSTLFLIFSAVVLHISAICAHPVPVISERSVLLPIEVHAIIGVNVTLNCSPPFPFKNTLIWSRNGTVMSIGRKKLTKNSARLRIRDGRNLEILNTIPEDRGSYRCHYPSSSDNATIAAYDFIVEEPRAADWDLAATAEPVMVINTVPAIATDAPEPTTWKLPGPTEDKRLHTEEVLESEHSENFPDDDRARIDKDHQDKHAASAIELQKKEAKSVFLAAQYLQEEATTLYLTPSRPEEASTFRITSISATSSRGLPLPANETSTAKTFSKEPAAPTVFVASSTEPPGTFTELSRQANRTVEPQTGMLFGTYGIFGNREEEEQEDFEFRQLSENEEDEILDGYLRSMNEMPTSGNRDTTSLAVSTTAALSNVSNAAEHDDEIPDDEIATRIPVQDKMLLHKDKIRDDWTHPWYTRRIHAYASGTGRMSPGHVDEVNSTDASVHLEPAHFFPEVPAWVGPLDGTKEVGLRHDRGILTNKKVRSWLNIGGSQNAITEATTDAATEAGIRPETNRIRQERVFLGNATLSKWYDNGVSRTLDLESATVAWTEAPLILATTSPITPKSLAMNVTPQVPLKTTVFVDITDGEVLVDDGNVSITVVMLKNDTAVKVNVNNGTRLIIRKARGGNLS